MKLKQGVDLYGIRPELVAVFPIIEGICQKHGQELVITSAGDGKHSRTSLHYVGYAIDIRTRFWDREEALEITRELHQQLSQDYDSVFEGNHIHIEYQRRYHG